MWPYREQLMKWFLKRGILMPMSRCTKVDTPTSIVLLGATGDLVRKKLLKALMRLFDANVLPEHFHIIAFSKDTLTNDEYRAFAKKYIAQKGIRYSRKKVAAFLQNIEYVQGYFDERDGFVRIKEALEKYDASIGMCTSKLFYLAVPPTYYDTIFEQIAYASLDLPCAGGDGWTRILVEKPFGSDLDHAYYLEDKLSVLFREEQIYRIDHYLAKDALQNILAFRFSNGIFENNWNKDYVESVFIRVFERIDVKNRGAFFDGVGALRDVGQNHMLQMLALVAMERPTSLLPEAIRGARADVLRALRPIDSSELGATLVKGQYKGYKKTKNVDATSTTETYFAFKTFVDTPRWKGVPFYLEHGKAMQHSSTEITLRFRSSKHCVCGNSEPHDHPNYVRFTISPDQRITVRFWVRKPGSKFELEPNDLVFDREKMLKKDAVVAEAYEEVLFDAICGDPTLFVSSGEQQAAWKFITGILRSWAGVSPLEYRPRSLGPASAVLNEVEQQKLLLD